MAIMAAQSPVALGSTIAPFINQQQALPLIQKKQQALPTTQNNKENK